MAQTEYSRSKRGPSILDKYWEELMSISERLYTGAEAEDGRDPGRAEGVAFCIALMTNPYKTDIEAVRKEVTRRWNEANCKLCDPAQHCYKHGSPDCTCPTCLE